MPVDAPKPEEECADLLGCCLWDVFADNHEVCTAKGALVDLGSFRAVAGFIADVRHRQSHSEARSNERREAAGDAEAAELRRNLDEAYKESVEETRHDPPPATVRAYQRVYGCFPAGWPPEVEGENSS